MQRRSWSSVFIKTSHYGFPGYACFLNCLIIISTETWYIFPMCSGERKYHSTYHTKNKRRQFCWDTLLFESTIRLVSYIPRFVAQAAPNECVNRSRSITTGRTLRAGLWNSDFIPDGCKNYLYGPTQPLIQQAAGASPWDQNGQSVTPTKQFHLVRG